MRGEFSFTTLRARLHHGPVFRRELTARRGAEFGCEAPLIFEKVQACAFEIVHRERDLEGEADRLLVERLEDERALDVPSGRVEVAGSFRQRGVAAQRRAEHPAPMAHVRREPSGVAVLGGDRLEQFDRPAVGRESLDVEVGGLRQGRAPERPLGFVGVDGESDVAAQREGHAVVIDETPRSFNVGLERAPQGVQRHPQADLRFAHSGPGPEGGDRRGSREPPAAEGQDAQQLDRPPSRPACVAFFQPDAVDTNPQRPDNAHVEQKRRLFGRRCSAVELGANRRLGGHASNVLMR